MASLRPEIFLRPFDLAKKRGPCPSVQILTEQLLDTVYKVQTTKFSPCPLIIFEPMTLTSTPVHSFHEHQILIEEDYTYYKNEENEEDYDFDEEAIHNMDT